MKLDDKFTELKGRIYLGGIDALVRLPIDQHRRDRRSGLNTATFVSGYPGSPLAGYDLALERARAHLREHAVVHRPGVNEELAATAVYGSQIFDLVPGPKYDGVLGIWYGKGPGVDRCGDAFRHANFVGTSRHGGVVVLAGDDHAAKSSTLPCQSDYALFAAGLPILYPGNVQEVLDLGLHGLALSRYSGAWVALKLVTNVCDGGATVEVDPDRPEIRIPRLELEGRPYEKVRDARLFPPHNLELEREVYYRRLEAARAYARANRLARVTVDGPDATLGIATAGKSYYDTRQALRDLGYADSELASLGIRLLKVDLIYPLEPTAVLEFARGLREIVVVEEKRGFLESQLRDALYNVAGHPPIYGKLDRDGKELFPVRGELDADSIAARLEKLVARRAPGVVAATVPAPLAALPPRLPNFCSGCPHNTSTVALPGQITGLGIGCHAMTVFRDGASSFYYVTQMGGEGAPWIAMAPFTETRHLFQNLGDGTYTHSGSLAVAACASAGVDITFKLLYNDAVAMTGGQAPAGSIPIPELTHKLRAEGAREIFVVAEDPRRYRDRRRLAPGVSVYGRDRLEQALRACEVSPGVSVLVYDQMCAKKKRRLRKRGALAEPALRAIIHPEVCEGCGDCGAKSNCMSLRPIETEFGPKTAIDQASCNKDYSCLKGDCPSFVTVEIDPAAAPVRAPGPPPDPGSLPEPAVSVSAERPYAVFMRGIGGTGVVTANALLATAAAAEGKFVLTLDQTGLAQMGGAVASHLVVADRPFEGANRTSARGADLILGFDVLGTAESDTLRLAHPERTVAVVNCTALPTGQMIRDKSVAFPDLAQLRRRIDAATSTGRNVYLDAGSISESLFGRDLMSNIVCLGAAYQAGLVPVAAESIEAAIRLNGVDVADNIAAFRWGRKCRIDPQALVPPAVAGSEPEATGPDLEELRAAGCLEAYRRLTADLPGPAGLRRVVSVRVAELVLYQDAAYAKSYVQRVREMAASEERVCPGRGALAEAAARYLYKLMAYKDEYEVARLLVRPRFAALVSATFGRVRRERFHLHPPGLRALGLAHKLRIPVFAARPALRLLYRLRFLRGTRWDPFGRARVRREERALVAWYNGLLDSALAALTPDNYDAVLEIVRLPDGIRGYEEIKLAAIARTRRLAEEKLGTATRAA